MKKVNVTYSERGFPQFDGAVETDYGHKVRVYGSSAAMKDCVWMSVAHDGVAAGLPEVDTAVHMDLEQAAAVRDRLSAWINTTNGYDDTDVAALRSRIKELEQWRTELADQLEPFRTWEDW